MEPQELAILCANLADSKKAQDIVVLDISPSSVADYFVIVSGESDVQVRAIAEAINRGCRKEGQKTLGRVEGLAKAEWVLQDYGDVIVHVFCNTARIFYDLDGFWGDAPRIEWTEPKVAP